MVPPVILVIEPSGAISPAQIQQFADHAALIRVDVEATKGLIERVVAGKAEISKLKDHFAKYDKRFSDNCTWASQIHHAIMDGMDALKNTMDSTYLDRRDPSSIEEALKIHDRTGKFLNSLKVVHPILEQVNDLKRSYVDQMDKIREHYRCVLEQTATLPSVPKSIAPEPMQQ